MVRHDNPGANDRSDRHDERPYEDNKGKDTGNTQQGDKGNNGRQK